MKNLILITMIILSQFTDCFGQDSHTYPVAGTNQTNLFNNSASISAPAAGEAFYGQNAFYPGNIPSYTDNGDGTLTITTS